MNSSERVLYTRLPNISRINLMGLLLLSIGFTTTVISMKNDYSFILFFSLSLLFWGILLTIILPGDYIKSQYHNEMIKSALATIDDLIKRDDDSLDFIYVPMPKDIHLPNLPEIQEYIYIEKKQTTKKIIQNIYDPNAKGIRIIPPGLFLTEFIEKELDLNFYDVDMMELDEYIKMTFIDKLDLLKKINLNYDVNTINIIYSSSKVNTISHLDMSVAHARANIIIKIGDPLISSLSCIVTRVIKKPIFIDYIKTDERSTTISYKILADQ